MAFWNKKKKDADTDKVKDETATTEKPSETK